MTQYEQKIKSYRNLSDKGQQKVINDENSLGFEALSSNLNGKQLTITYRRNNQLKHMYRLKDLENKIERIESYKSEMNSDLIKLDTLKRTKLASEKKVAWFMLLIILLIDLITIFRLVSMTGAGNELFEGILWVLVAIGLHVLHVFWFKLIKKRGSDDAYKEALYRLDTQLKVLYKKANHISKEIIK